VNGSFEAAECKGFSIILIWQALAGQLEGVMGGTPAGFLSDVT